MFVSRGRLEFYFAAINISRARLTITLLNTDVRIGYARPFITRTVPVSHRIGVLSPPIAYDTRRALSNRLQTAKLRSVRMFASGDRPFEIFVVTSVYRRVPHVPYCRRNGVTRHRVVFYTRFFTFPVGSLRALRNQISRPFRNGSFAFRTYATRSNFRLHYTERYVRRPSRNKPEGVSEHTETYHIRRVRYTTNGGSENSP